METEDETRVDRAPRALVPEREEMGDFEGWMRALRDAGLDADGGKDATVHLVDRADPVDD